MTLGEREEESRKPDVGELKSPLSSSSSSQYFSSRLKKDSQNDLSRSRDRNEETIRKVDKNRLHKSSRYSDESDLSYDSDSDVRQKTQSRRSSSHRTHSRRDRSSSSERRYRARSRRSDSDSDSDSDDYSSKNRSRARSRGRSRDSSIEKERRLKKESSSSKSSKFGVKKEVKLEPSYSVKSEKREQIDKKDKKEKKEKKDKKYKKEKSSKREKRSKKDRKDRKDRKSTEDSDSSDETSSESNSDVEFERRLRAAAVSANQGLAPSSHALVSEEPLAALGYSSSQNRFNDPDIAKPFLWTKKLKQIVDKGEALPELSVSAFRAKQMTNFQQIQKIKARRELREIEVAQRQLLDDQVRRDLDVESNRDWDDKEAEFHKKQALKRTEIRIQEGRERPVDLLVKNIHLKLRLEDPLGVLEHALALGESLRETRAKQAFLNSLEVDLLSPAQLIEGLTLPALIELKQDIDDLLLLEQDASGLVEGGITADGMYWHAALLVCEREIAIGGKRKAAMLRGTTHTREDFLIEVVRAESGLLPAVIPDVLRMLENKTVRQIDKIAQEVQHTIAQAEMRVSKALEEGNLDAVEALRGIDLKHWYGVRNECAHSRAKAFLTSFHKKLLKRRKLQLTELAQLEAVQREKEILHSLESYTHGTPVQQDLRSTLSSLPPSQSNQGVGQVDLIPSESTSAISVVSSNNLTLENTLDNRVNTSGSNSRSEVDELLDIMLTSTTNSVSTQPSLIPVAEMDFEPSLVPYAQWQISEQKSQWDARVLDEIQIEKEAYKTPPSPPLLAITAIPPSLHHEFVTQDEDNALIETLRSVVMSQLVEDELVRIGSLARPTKTSRVGTSLSAVSVIEGQGDMQGYLDPTTSRLEADEEDMSRTDSTMGSEVSLISQTYTWRDKHRPRKPRYFNKVKTGFDWNRYNQTHYDKENPPPKVVQGYQFNIFYPDLIDPSIPPKYWLEEDPSGNADYCVIRFSAGAPYEDVAFKIVRKKWQTAPQHGFKCTFMRGTFSLWFNFTRVWYRR